jgi:hypothetical protein
MNKNCRLKFISPAKKFLDWQTIFFLYFEPWYSTVQYSTVQYSTVQYSTVQYSIVQYSTVQYSTVQYRTVQYKRQFHLIFY